MEDMQPPVCVLEHQERQEAADVRAALLDHFNSESHK